MRAFGLFLEGNSKQNSFQQTSFVYHRTSSQSLLCCVSVLVTEMESFTLSEVESYCESEMERPSESEIDPLVGIIFDPKDEEAIIILKHKRSHPDFDHPAIYEADIYKYEPYQLPGLPAIQSNGNMYFFCALKPLDASGERYGRSTETGHWKVTCKPVKIKAECTHDEIGERRTLVFYEDSPGCPKGVKTNWFMYEFSAYANNNPLFKDLVVCKIREEKETGKKEKEKEKKEDKKRSISTKNESKRVKKRPISTNDAFQLEPQLPPDYHLISNPRGDAVENSYPKLQYHAISNFNNHAIEDTLQVDPLPLENLNVSNGCTTLDQTSSPGKPSILPEKGSSSSGVSINENEVLNCPFGNESQWEDYLQYVFVAPEYEFLVEESGHTGGFCGGDSSDVVTEILNARVNKAF